MAEIVIHSNNIENIVLGRLTARWNASGTRILRYYLDVRHTAMNLHRELSAPEIFILQSKADALIAAWDEKYVQHRLRATLQSGKSSAEDLSAAAIQKLDGLHRLLANTLSVNDAVDWDALKDRRDYPMPKQYERSKPRFEERKPPAYEAPAISWWSKLTGKAAEIEAKAVGHALGLMVERIRCCGVLSSGGGRQVPVEEVYPYGGAVARYSKRIGAVRSKQSRGTIFHTQTQTAAYKRSHDCYLSFKPSRSTLEKLAVTRTKPRRCVIWISAPGLRATAHATPSTMCPLHIIYLRR